MTKESKGKLEETSIQGIPALLFRCIQPLNFQAESGKAAKCKKKRVRGRKVGRRVLSCAPLPLSWWLTACTRALSSSQQLENLPLATSFPATAAAKGSLPGGKVTKPRTTPHL